MNGFIQIGAELLVSSNGNLL